MKNARHSNPIIRGVNDEPPGGGGGMTNPKKSHITLFACII